MDSAGPGPDRSRQRVKLAAVLGGTVLMASPLLLHRGALIDPIAPVVTVGSALLGLALGAYASLRLGKRVLARGPRGYVALLSFPVGLAVLGTYYARLAVETWAFTGVHYSEQVADVPVESRSNNRSGMFADLLPARGGRRLQARISQRLYDRLDPYRAPGRDCLALDIETGRDGIRRIELPNRFDAALGVDRLVPCAPSRHASAGETAVPRAGDAGNAGNAS